MLEIDCRRVRQSFARVAGDYAGHDFFAREIDQRMQARLDLVKLRPGLIVDLGCSRGASAEGLRQRYPGADWLGIDYCTAMLQGAGRGTGGWRRWLPEAMRRDALFAAADAGQLPVRAASAGLVWSNLLLHWLADPLPVMAEAARVLETGGLLMFSTLGPDTLKELRGVFDDGYVHTQHFADMHDLGDMLVHCGFADPVMDMEVLTLTYSDLPALLAELRASGSICAMQGRRRGLVGRAAWQRWQARALERMQDGRLPATFEVIYGHAWKAQPKKLADGSAVVRFMNKPAA